MPNLAISEQELNAQAQNLAANDRSRLDSEMMINEGLIATTVLIGGAALVVSGVNIEQGYTSQVALDWGVVAGAAYAHHHFKKARQAFQTAWDKRVQPKPAE